MRRLAPLMLLVPLLMAAASFAASKHWHIGTARAAQVTQSTTR
ncbi:MAG TPA: hypothetical protein VKN99_08645 [Polyangia bacterium]|nr:hypothetical protein [Polyangia bacterium]